jgi:hypothetical protein
MDGFFVAKFKKFANGDRKLEENQDEQTKVNPEGNEQEVKEKLAEKKKKEN